MTLLQKRTRTKPREMVSNKLMGSVVAQFKLNLFSLPNMGMLEMWANKLRTYD